MLPLLVASAMLSNCCSSWELMLVHPAIYTAIGVIVQTIVSFVSEFEKRAHFTKNGQFSTYHNLKTPTALGWFLGTPALLLKKSNVRKHIYVLTWKGGAPNF